MKKNKIFRYVPIWTLPILSLAVISAVINIVAVNSVAFADWFNKYISSFSRAVFSYITYLFPFSLGELIIIAIPLIAVLLLTVGVKAARSNEGTSRFCVGILAVISLFYTTFVCNFGVSYHTAKLEDKLGLDRAPLSAQELYDTGLWLAQCVNELEDDVNFGMDGFSVMPYSLYTMNGKLMAAYDSACYRYGFLQRLHSRIKPVMLSKAMSYMHITGVYSTYTGEANINIDFPPYTVAYTAGHELAHQRGIAREDEANFVSFLVLKDSDDAYLRYCAYLNMFEYVGNSLYSASPEKYFELYGMLDLNVKGEIAAYSEFFKKYENSKASEVSEAVNDTYLKLQGTQGTVSYGLVTDLAAAYYKSEIAPN